MRKIMKFECKKHNEYDNITNGTFDMVRSYATL